MHKKWMEFVIEGALLRKKALAKENILHFGQFVAAPDVEIK